MTRTHRDRPTWTWRCDHCGVEHGLAREQADLPSKSDMVALGWYIAPLYGDICQSCYTATLAVARDFANPKEQS